MGLPVTGPVKTSVSTAVPWLKMRIDWSGPPAVGKGVPQERRVLTCWRPSGSISTTLVMF